MPLTAGSTLGSYEIAGLLGTGGMGEVYLARDTRLGRNVAVKVLPEAFLADADRVARFEREAKMLAALNHPHIAALHSMEKADGRHFLVMELVEGETLAERIRRGPIPVGEALSIARQIAEALEAAHERGVIHRDLKPANVKITQDESVKVLDFGLAKALESPARGSDVANSPTLSMMASQVGLILGTAAYMSPEQARGLPADQRSDIFSFGSVLYEMLTGRSPFQGETAPDILASVLVREPDLQALPSGLNPRIVDLLRRCLEKPPKRRWQAIGDLRVEIETILAAPSGPIAVAPVASPHRPMWRRALPVAIAAVSASALTAAIFWSSRPDVPSPAVTRFRLTPQEGQLLSSIGRQVIAISPTGSHIAYVSNGGLFLRAMSDVDAKPIQGAETGRGLENPVFSPDGRYLLFWAPDRTIKRLAVTGGAAVTLCPATVLYGLSWTSDGIVFGQTTGIMRVPPEGGTPELIVSTKSGEIAQSPQLLPGGKALLFTLSTGATAIQWDQATIVVQSLESGERRRLVEGGSDARYVPTGHVVYALGGTLFALPFDPRSAASPGTTAPVLEGVQRAAAGSTGIAQFGFSNNGTLVYMPGPAGGARGLYDIALVDRKGVVEPLRLPEGPYTYPRVSPNGRHITFGTDDSQDPAVWIHDLGGTSALRRLTFGGANRLPIWSSDSQRIAFQSDRDGDLAIFTQRADGTGPVERLTKPEPGSAHIPDAWSPDGAHLLFTVRSAERFTVWLLSLRDRTTAQLGNFTSSALPTGVFSPDGRWIAYTMAKAGANDSVVNVQPFPATGATYQVFAKAGDNPHHPLWSPDGKELLYIPRVGGFEAVSVVTAPVFAFGNPVPVPRAFPTASPTTARTFDITPDGRIISLGSGGANAIARNVQGVHVVLNWFEELKTRLPAAR